MPVHYRKLLFLVAALPGAIVLLIAVWTDAQGSRAGLPTETEDQHASRPAPTGELAVLVAPALQRKE